MTFLILISILTVSMAVANIAISELKMGGAQTHSTKANFAADAGAERMLYELIKGSFSPWGCNVDEYLDLDNHVCAPAAPNPPFTEVLSNLAEYDVKYTSSTPKIIKSEGKFQDTKRNIELEFE